MTIFLDLDGTILEVSGRFYAVYKNLMEEGGYKTLSKKLYWRLKRDKCPEKKIIRKSNATVAFFKRYNPERIRLLEDIEYLKHDRIIRGALKTLKRLKKENKLVLVTVRANRNSLLKELCLLKIRRFFDEILVAPAGKEPWKTKVKLIKDKRYVLRDAVFIGDTEIDILAAKALKVKSIAVLSGLRSKKVLKAYKPDRLINSIGGFKWA